MFSTRERPPGSEAVLEIDGLAAGYGRNRVIKDSALTVAAGELVCMIGANGAGKSTLLKAIVGHNRIFAGRIRLHGVDLVRQKPHDRVRAGLGYVPQGRQVFPGLSVRDNLLMGCFSVRNRKIVDERIESVYAQFPALRKRASVSAGLLSGGEQQMLAIGRALATHPKLVIMDEPTLGLAPVIVDEVVEQIQRLKAAGTTVLMVEQNTQIALEISDRAYVVEQGTTSGSLDPGQVLSEGIVEKLYLGMQR